MCRCNSVYINVIKKDNNGIIKMIIIIGLVCIAAGTFIMMPVPEKVQLIPKIPDLAADFIVMLNVYAEQIPENLDKIKAIRESVEFASKDPMSLPFKQKSFKELIALVPFLDAETKLRAWNYLTSLAMESTLNDGNIKARFQAFHEEIGNRIGEELYKSKPADELPPEPKSRFWKTVFVGVGIITFVVIPPLVKVIESTFI